MYNNQFYPQVPQTYPQIRQNNGINWVQGIEGAKAYQLMPNSNAVLMDSENDGVFYIKISDNVGICNLRTFKYEEITDFGVKNLESNDYVKKSELQELVTAIIGGLKDEQPIPATKPSKTITK